MCLSNMSKCLQRIGDKLDVKAKHAFGVNEANHFNDFQRVLIFTVLLCSNALQKAIMTRSWCCLICKYKACIFLFYYFATARSKVKNEFRDVAETTMVFCSLSHVTTETLS